MTPTREGEAGEKRSTADDQACPLCRWRDIDGHESDCSRASPSEPATRRGEPRCFQCQLLWETECQCGLPDPMLDPDAYAETIKRDRRRGAVDSPHLAQALGER